MSPIMTVKTIIHFASEDECYAFQAQGMSIVIGYAVGNLMWPVGRSLVCRNENASR